MGYNREMLGGAHHGARAFVGRVDKDRISADRVNVRGVKLLDLP